MPWGKGQTWDRGQWVQAMLMVKSRETVWEGQTEMAVRTEQVITQPTAASMAKVCSSFGMLLWLNSIPTKAQGSLKLWQAELGPPALPAGFRNPHPTAQFLYPQVGFVLFF